MSYLEDMQTKDIMWGIFFASLLITFVFAMGIYLAKNDDGEKTFSIPYASRFHTSAKP